MKALALVLLTGVPGQAFTQLVLHYTETSGFDHNTRLVSEQFFISLGNDLGFTVVNDNDGSQFDQLSNLLQFDVIVFSNTSGDALLNAQQQANFMAYVDSGGSVLGIHAATDTYRHSTANGNNTGTWDFYAELMGASVQENPNHVSGTPAYDLSHVAPHASTIALPDPWTKNEEYYYWESGYFRQDNVVVLEVEETLGPNGLVNSYDAPRAMSWYRELSQGGRVFCTALGPAVGNFTGDTLFREHIAGALGWLMEAPSAILDGAVPLVVTRNGCIAIPAECTIIRAHDAHGRTLAVNRNADEVCLAVADCTPRLSYLLCNSSTGIRVLRILRLEKDQR